MRATVHAGSLVGIEAHPVLVEVDFIKGLPGFDLIGLPETSVRESRVRVLAAIEANGWEIPRRRLLVNLAPGDLRKRGTCFDLAIAVGVLAASQLCAPTLLAETLLLGELSLAGDIRPVRGVLAQLRSAARRGLRTAVVPAGNAAEAGLALDIDVRLSAHLRDVVAFFSTGAPLARASRLDGVDAPTRELPDLQEVRGQQSARRAIEVAAAGGHHLLLVGPPGAGKTMLARRLPGLLPAPTDEEALEIATIAGAAGLAVPGGAGGVGRPFRAPHHSASMAALVGGGDPVRPGEVTLAHGGVLFLDELPELRRDALESLRTTMESGFAQVARVRERVTMPAHPLVVAAMNPCPCGYAGESSRICSCSPAAVHRYMSRISGPLLDRFDLHVAVPRVSTRALMRAAEGEPSAVVRARVARARARVEGDQARPEGLAQLTVGVSAGALRLVDRAADTLGLSARAFVKVLRVARTVALLAERETVSEADVAEALAYRALDRHPAVAVGPAATAGAERAQGARQGDRTCH